MLDLVLIIIFCILGVCMGILTGLLPGLHVNNIALILLSISGTIVALASPLNSYGISNEFILLLIAGFIISVSVSHTFHDVIPTTFIGAPDEDSALSVLPAHELLLKGQGYRAVVLSAMGSYGAIVVGLIIIYPLRFIIGSPIFFYNTLQGIMAWVLIAIALLMLATEKTRITDFGASGKLPSVIGMGFALFVFILSGIFGLIVLDYEVTSPIGLNSPVLFPALAGLFGFPTLINSLMTEPVIPDQKIEKISLSEKGKKSSVISVITGSIAGIFVSIIPGITSATGTVIAMNAREGSDHEQTIVTLSSVNTASSFAVILVLFIILRPRSGAAIAVNELIIIEEWLAISIPQMLSFLVIFIVLAGSLSYFFTIVIGRFFARGFSKIPYTKLVAGTILMVGVLVFLFTGVVGILVLFVATSIGFIPVLWGVRRSHCMGILLVPIIIHFLGV